MELVYDRDHWRALVKCVSYYGDDMEKYRRLCSWEDNIKMALKEIGVDMMS